MSHSVVDGRPSPISLEKAATLTESIIDKVDQECLLPDIVSPKSDVKHFKEPLYEDAVNQIINVDHVNLDPEAVGVNSSVAVGSLLEQVPSDSNIDQAPTVASQPIMDIVKYIL